MVDKTLILRKLKKYKNFTSDAEFANFLGISTQNISAWYKRNTFNENKIVDKFPEVNKIWLLTGEGEMLKNTPIQADKQTAQETDESSIIRNLIESNASLAKSIEIMAESNRELTKSNAILLAQISKYLKGAACEDAKAVTA